MGQYSSYVLKTQMEANAKVLHGLFGNVEILAKGLTAESSEFDVGKVTSHMSTIQTYTSLMDAAGQILTNRKGIREPRELVVHIHFI